MDFGNGNPRILLANHRLKLTAHLVKFLSARSLSLSVRRTSGGGIAKAENKGYDNTYGIEYENWGPYGQDLSGRRYPISFGFQV